MLNKNKDSAGLIKHLDSGFYSSLHKAERELYSLMGGFLSESSTKRPPDAAVVQVTDCLWALRSPLPDSSLKEHFLHS